MKKDQVHFSQRLLSGVLSMALTTQPMLPAVAATLTPQGNTQVDKAANGVPVVNIATPNQSGISHNKYNDYNVAKEGLILNNTTGQLNATQLGGIIQGNPNLKAGQEAKGIINEVTGANRSQLQGYTEVAGKAANVIVANPYGITCNGCGFINTPQATLTTGKPVFDVNGNLQALDVTKGSITIEGTGLDGNQSDAVAIISRATALNAALYAKEVKVIAGANRVGVDGKISALNGEGEVPKVAVDTGALGGMYANRIRLVSSEKGLGVNLGNLNARQGDITLDASGKLVVSNSLASGALTVKGQHVTLTGDHKAGDDLTISSQGDIALNQTTLLSDKNLYLSADGTLAQNGGTLTAGQNLALRAKQINQQQTAQVDAAGNMTLRSRDKAQLQGKLTAGKTLDLRAGALTNSGSLVAGTQATVNAGQLTNSGTILGATGVTVTATTLDTAEKSAIVSGSDLTLNAQTLNNRGVLNAVTSRVSAEKVVNHGLIQGEKTLSLVATMLDLLSGSSMLTGGALSLTGTTFMTAGHLQGQTVSLNAQDWQNRGNMLATGDLAVKVTQTMTTSGDIMSQGKATLITSNMDNQGNLLSAGDLSLTSNDLVNSGSLLTAGDLTLTADDIHNTGQWQGKHVLVKTRDLTNRGALQAEDRMTVTLSGKLQGSSDNKITSNGELALSALTMNNAGQWIAKNLTLQADTLINNGEVTGVDGLTVTLRQTLDNQPHGKLLSAGDLQLNAATVTNAGQIQGKATRLATDTLLNRGRIQGETLRVNAASELTNAADGLFLSQNALNITAPVLLNNGTVQGGGSTAIQATLRAQNDGTLISGDTLTLRTADLDNANGGLIQAVTLLLNVVNAVNNGRILAVEDAQLRGTTLNNSGTLQAADLRVNYQDFTNAGTTLGLGLLAIDSDVVSNTANGKLFSADDLLINSQDLSSAGQVVALGDITLNLVNELTHSGTLAAGQALSLSSRHAISNNGVMQGNSLALNAGGAFTNSGQLTTGYGNSTFTAQRIMLNASGSLQAGGDVQLSSLSDITVNGFTGTAGNLTMNAAGTLLNSALIYAANTMQLFADRIHNLHGDILAGNRLWMQKNAAGAANREVLNTSGNIETLEGDITIKTEHLLNERDGLTVTEKEFNETTELDSTLLVNILDVPLDQVGYYEYQYCSGTKNTHCYDATAFILTGEDERQVLVKEKSVVAAASGGAAHIASGGNIIIEANLLDNKASHILAVQDVTLSGETLNNFSAETSKISQYGVYTYKCTRDCERELTYGLSDYEIKNLSHKDVEYINYIYQLQPALKEIVETEPSSLMRAAIQAGGDITASFTRDISNTLTTANSNGYSNTVTVPTLNTINKQTIDSGGNAQGLAEAGTATITTPQWHDAITEALQESDLDNHSGADTSAYPLPSGINGYFVPSTDPDSPYLITVNPKLDGLGQVDQSLYGDLYALLGMKPGDAPRETNAAYTDQTQFLGSAYFLDKINLDPDRDYRFLGDAAFDTRYVSNYLLNQTGSRYINGLGSDLEQMRYLMDSAATQQQALGLQFGVALTAEQVAALDQSMLWWESTTLNGQTVMIPKVYLSPKDVTVQRGSVISGNNVQLAGGSMTNSGSTIVARDQLTLDASNSFNNLNAGLINAGGNLSLSALGDINNIGSAISGKTVTLESVTGSINNLTQAQQWDITATGYHSDVSIHGTTAGSTASVTATDVLAMWAGQDLNVTGANVAAGGSMALAAGNDINISANEIAQGYTGHGRGTTSVSSVSQQSSMLTAGGDLTLLAGNDVTARAAGIAAEGDVGIQAGRDVNLLAEATSHASASKSKKKTSIDESVRQQGTEIASGGNTVIIAGRDMNAEAADLTAQGDIGVAAGRDINLTTATESDYRYREKTRTSSGFLSKKTTHTISEDSTTREKGTLLSGDNVTVSAGNNLLVEGSSVVGDGNVALVAGNNVDINAATNTDTSWRFKEEKKSGLMGTGGIGFTIGSSKTTHDMREKGTTQSGSFSTVGSTGGNVSIQAGQQTHISGADIIAQKNIILSGDSVMIEPGHDRRTRDETFEQRSSGLTLALSGVAGSAINNAVETTQAAQNESDSRLAALQTTKAALSGVQAGQALAVAQASGEPNNGIGISASLSSQKSKSEQHMQSDTVAGSTLNAGDNLAIIATGNGGGESSGDIRISGSQIKAGSDTVLAAANDIALGGAANTQHMSGKNSSSGGGVGVSVGGGTNGYGISVFANVNAANGNEKGNGTAWTETTLDSGGAVTMTAGRDAILSGAQVSGDSIVADIGRDLWISSQQDSNDYHAKQNSVAAGGSFTFGSMTGSGYISASQDNINSTYDSVQEQTGLYAGEGGFDVTVGRHTQLDGAVIASTATADKNRLDTGTLGFRDINNEADYQTRHSGISLSGGSTPGGDFSGSMPGGMITAGGSSGHAQGTTQAAVAEGSITVRDTAGQQQDVTTLSRDTANANDSISPIFDKEKEQKRLQEVGLIGDIGSQAADIARTQGDIKGLTEAKKAHPDMTADELRQTGTYQAEMQKYGTGSDLQRGIQAATAALQGLAGGDVTGALAGASAPELANIIGHQSGLSEDAALVAHAILGGAAAALQGNSAAAGAAGAVSGELAAKAIMTALYPGKAVSDLSETERQTVSMLATVSAGMAGGLAGDSTASAVAGAQGGRNAVENNLLGGGTEEGQAEFIRQHGLDMASCETAPASASCQKAINERDAVGFAMASAGLVYLPGGMQITAGIGGSANAGIQYLINGEVNPTDVLIATYVGAFTANTGLWGTMGWNAAGGATSNYLKGDDALAGAGWSAAGSAFGYGVGKYLIEVPMNKILNPVWKSYEWVDIGMGISRPLPPSLIPKISGNTGAALGTETGGQLGPKVIDILEKR